jgi:7,8-dihydropterin-6-yl-methyl-4-(beta-D-ribofuranosyl)aminobenzene 5'-phosphate synthase
MPGNSASALKLIDSLVVEVITDDVSDTYVSKTLFAVSEFSNVVLAGPRSFPARRCYARTWGLG